MLASRFVQETLSLPAALVLLGTTHPRDFSLAGLPIPVTKIYAELDGIAPYSRVLENKRLLPESTKWIRIEGGNHVQFGYYRHQLGDNPAAISRTAQQNVIEGALLDVLAARSGSQAALRRSVNDQARLVGKISPEVPWFGWTARI
jgi:hypothetical protein